MDTTTLYLFSIGIDIGKEVFHIVGFGADGKIAFRRKIKRLALAETFKKLPPCVVGMEACLSAHLRQLGHKPKIIPAIYVKPFVKGQKNDYNDAEAIAEASLRPNLRTVREKTQDQLDLQACHRVRSRPVSRRTATINHPTGLRSRCRAVQGSCGSGVTVAHPAPLGDERAFPTAVGQICGIDVVGVKCGMTLRRFGTSSAPRASSIAVMGCLDQRMHLFTPTRDEGAEGETKHTVPEMRRPLPQDESKDRQVQREPNAQNRQHGRHGHLTIFEGLGYPLAGRNGRPYFVPSRHRSAVAAKHNPVRLPFGPVSWRRLARGVGLPQRTSPTSARS
jgi:Transposase